jgi:hypothetical protein
MRPLPAGRGRRSHPRRTEIVWRDSTLDNGGWSPVKQHLRARWGEEIHSVGIVLLDDKEGITLAASVHGDEAAGVVHIPSGMILKRKRLR